MEERPGRALELTRGRSPGRHNLFQVAAGALGLLGAELVDVDSLLEAENLHLARDWHQLIVAINLGCLKHEQASTIAEASLAIYRLACAWVQEEARAADRHRKAVEECEREL